jgi:hypothetical protein
VKDRPQPIPHTLHCPSISARSRPIGSHSDAVLPLAENQNEEGQENRSARNTVQRRNGPTMRTWQPTLACEARPSTRGEYVPRSPTKQSWGRAHASHWRVRRYLTAAHGRATHDVVFAASNTRSVRASSPEDHGG